MTPIVERYKAELRVLSQDERAELAQFLISSLDDELDGPDDPEYEAAWKAEIERRVEEIESGKVVGRPVDEVMAELRAKFS